MYNCCMSISSVFRYMAANLGSELHVEHGSVATIDLFTTLGKLGIASAGQHVNSMSYSEYIRYYSDRIKIRRQRHR